MSHYAKIENGIVQQVIVAEQDFIDQFCEGQWVQTSYRTYQNQHPEGHPLRGNYAGIGYHYDSNNDVFYAPQPFPSWVLNTSIWTWEAPVPYPNDGKNYYWDESVTAWVEGL